MELRTKMSNEVLHENILLGMVGTFESAFQDRQMQGHISRVKNVGQKNNSGVVTDNHLNMNFSCHHVAGKTSINMRTLSKHRKLFLPLYIASVQ